LFVEWALVLEKEDNKTELLHAYLAQVALEVCRTRMKNPTDATLKDFELKLKEEASTTPKESVDQKKALVAFWLTPNSS
jgi:hypothetical protein